MALDIDLLRFVRDTDSLDHMEPALERMFGAATVQAAIDAGLIETQVFGDVWYGHERTAYVDLTAAGERRLCLAAGAR